MSNEVKSRRKLVGNASGSKVKGEEELHLQDEVRVSEIRIGDAYQATLPTLIKAKPNMTGNMKSKQTDDPGERRSHSMDKVCWIPDRITQQGALDILEFAHKLTREPNFDIENPVEGDELALHYLAEHNYDVDLAKFRLLSKHGVGKDEAWIRYAILNDLDTEITRGPDRWKKTAVTPRIYNKIKNKKGKRRLCSLARVEDPSMQVPLESLQEWKVQTGKVLKKCSKENLVATREQLVWFALEFQRLSESFIRPRNCTGDALWNKLDSTYNALCEKLESIEIWIAQAHDLIGQTINESVLQQLKSLVHQVSSSLHIDFLEYRQVIKIIRNIDQWKEKCIALGKDATTLQDLEDGLREASRLNIQLPQRMELIERIQGVQELADEINFMFPNKKKSRKKQQKLKTLAELKEFCERVQATGINIPEYVKLEYAIEQAEKWLSQVTSSCSNNSSIKSLEGLLAEVDSIGVDLSKEAKDLQDLVRTGKDWIERVRHLVPRQLKTRRAVPISKVDIKIVQSLLDEAPKRIRNSDFDYLVDIVSKAEEWLCNVKQAMSDEDLSEMRVLHNEAQYLPVVLEEQVLLEAEVEARNWEEDAFEMMKAKADLHDFEQLLERGVEKKDALTSEQVTKWRKETEDAVIQISKEGRQWITCFEKMLGQSISEKWMKSDGSHHSEAKFVLPPAHTIFHGSLSKPCLQAVKDLNEESKAIQINLSSYREVLDHIISEAESVDQLAATFLQQWSEPHNCAPLDEALSILDKLNQLYVLTINGEKLRGLIHQAEEWIEKVKAICLRRTQRGKKQEDRATVDELLKLSKEYEQLYFAYAEDFALLQNEISLINLWREQYAVLLKDFVADVHNSVKLIVQSDYVERQLVVENRKKQVFSLEEKKRLLLNPKLAIHDESSLTSLSCFKYHPQQPQQSQQSQQSQQHQLNRPLPEQHQQPIQELLCSQEKVVVDSMQGEKNLDSKNPNSVYPIESLKVLLKSQKRQAKSPLSSDVKFYIPLQNNIASSFEILEQMGKRRTISRSSTPNHPTTEPSAGVDDALKQLSCWFQRIDELHEHGQNLCASTPETIQLDLLLRIKTWCDQSRTFLLGNRVGMKEFDHLIEEGMLLKKEISQVIQDDTFMVLLAQLHMISKEKESCLWWKEKVKEFMEKKGVDLDSFIELIHSGWDLMVDMEEQKKLAQEARKVKGWLARLDKVLSAAVKSETKRLPFHEVESLVMESQKLKISLKEVDILSFWYESAVSWSERVQDLWSEKESENKELESMDRCNKLLEEYTKVSFMIDMPNEFETLESVTLVYCICREPDDGFMIGCDSCDEWYHGECIGLSPLEAEQVDKYACCLCNIQEYLVKVLEEALGVIEYTLSSKEMAIQFKKRKLENLEILSFEQEKYKIHESIVRQARNKLVLARNRRHQEELKLREIQMQLAITQGTDDTELSTIQHRIQQAFEEEEEAAQELNRASAQVAQTSVLVAEASACVREFVGKEIVTNQFAINWIKEVQDVFTCPAIFSPNSNLFTSDGEMPRMFQDLITRASTTNITYLPDILLILHVLRAIPWGIQALHVLQRKPHENDWIHILSCAKANKVADRNVLEFMESIVSRADKWKTSVLSLMKEIWCEEIKIKAESLQKQKKKIPVTIDLAAEFNAYVVSHRSFKDTSFSSSSSSMETTSCMSKKRANSDINSLNGKKTKRMGKKKKSLNSSSVPSTPVMEVSDCHQKDFDSIATRVVDQDNSNEIRV